jgi:hypothetical protein
MAIQFLEKPDNCTRVGQRLIYIAISNQISQQGFRYCFEVELNSGIGAGKYYFVQPNFNDAGVFDASPVLFELLYPTKDTGLHYSGDTFSVDDTLNQGVNVKCYEGYLVGGVFTIVTESFVGWKSCVYRGAFQHKDGYKPNPDTYLQHHSMVDTNSLFNSAIKVGTFPCPPELYTAGQSISINPNSDVIVPSRASDYGAMYVHPTDSPCNLGQSTRPPYPYIQINSYDIEGNFLGEATVTQSANIKVPTCSSLSFPFYFRNCMDGGLIYPDTYFYTVQFIDDVFEYPASARYIVYNAEACNTDARKKGRYQNIRIGWYNKVGGVDYYTFTKAKTYTNSFERKRYKRVTGNYATAISGDDNFTFSPSDRGLQETRVQSYLTIDMQSDWISEGEFKFLNDIRESHFVFIVFTEDFTIQDYGVQIGEITPVVVEDSSYNIQQVRSGQKYNQKLTVRLAHDNWTA